MLVSVRILIQSGYFSQTSSCASLAEAALQVSQQKVTLLLRWRVAERHQEKNIHRIVFTPSDFFLVAQLRFSSGYLDQEGSFAEL